MRVAVLDDYQNVALKLADWSAVETEAPITVFNDHLEGIEAVAERLHDFEIVVIMRERTPLPRALIEKLPNLKLLVTAGMRNLAIDLDAASEHGVVVTGTKTLGYPVAEMTWGLLLALARHIPREDQATREGEWQTSIGMALNGKVLGVIGLGRVGAMVARFGKAFEMEVIAWSRNLTDERCAEVGVRRASKEELLTSADVISVHVVLSDRTRGLIGANELRMMKPTAYLVNTSRGPVVDEVALIEALSTRSIAGAAIDVYECEPLPADHPLRSLEHTVISPHLGYVVEDNYRVIYGEAAEDVRAFLDGEPVRVLNPEVLENPAAG